VLLDAILTVLGRPSEANAGRRQAPVTRHSLHESKRPLRILVADDNRVNRHLVTAILEKQGHAVTAVEDGHQAVAAASSGTFDVALMDVQMPGLDGFEATAAIRAGEGLSARHLPIVALTARAMQGDREACLAAEMDDYLSKPIRASELLAMIERITGGLPDAPPPVVPAGSFIPTSFDLKEALSRVEGDRTLLADLIDLFRSDSPGMLAEIRRSVAAADPEGLQKAAHALRGAADNFCALVTTEAAGALEAMGQGGSLAGAESRVAELEAALEGLGRDLTLLRSREGITVTPSTTAGTGTLL
jgi:CheY-like chemotaxis protein/HPt (histidine-containing phosphotransfer) domain-containing protein